MKKDEIKQLWLESNKTLIIEIYDKVRHIWMNLVLTNPSFTAPDGEYRFKENQDFSVINDKVKKAWEDSGRTLAIEVTHPNGAWIDSADLEFCYNLIYRIKPGQLKEPEKAIDTTGIDGKPLSALDSQVGGHHYKDMKIQPIEFCYLNKIPVIESSIIRYVCRHKNKNGFQDLEKARHFIDILIELEYKNKGD